MPILPICRIFLIFINMTEFIYFEESWNENRGGEILDGGASTTRETEDDTKRPRGQE